MFEEICLVCGKYLLDYGQAYCSDDCQGRDITSPSISSSSSAFSSPHLSYANGADVPPLMPSTLGSALKNIRGRDSYSIRQSTATWSVLDDEDDDAVRADFVDPTELAQDGISKQFGFPCPLKPSALQYTRRPSGTNNHSTVPHVHKRMSSNSSSGNVKGVPRSAPHPSHSSTEDDESCSDFGSSSRENLDTEESDVPSERGSDAIRKNLDTEKTLKPRNRASLPAYFSLLQITSPAGDKRSSPLSSSSGHTVARPSPPTPKLALASRLPQALEFSNLHTTPRGRKRLPGASSSSHRPDSSNSRSRSRARYLAHDILSAFPGHNFRGRFDGRESTDCSSMPGQVARGRPTVRRNSSPPPKVLLGMEERGRTLAAVRQAEIYDRSQSGSRNPERPRGRARVAELDGIGFTALAPGYGSGRTGLVGRERNRERERSLGLAVRLPQ